MIRVMHICPQLGKGGIEKLIQQWEEKSKENGVEFLFGVYIPGGFLYDYFLQKGYNIITIQQAKKIGVREYINQIARIVSENKVDILHINAGAITWLTLKGAKKGGVKHRFLHAHTNLYLMNYGRLINKMIYQFSIRQNVKYATRLLACGEEAGKYCYGKHEFTLLKNGIDIEKFSYSEYKRKKIREEYGIDDEFVLGFVGRLEHQKNPMFAIETFHELKKIIPEAKMLILGEGSYREGMEAYCRDNKIAKDVIFCGVVADPSPYYSAMDGFMLPSWYEGLGIVAVEAEISGQQVHLSTYIPSEAGICENVQFHSLDEGAKQWAGYIAKGREVDRIDRSAEILAAGYDKNQSVQKLMEIYKETCR